MSLPYLPIDDVLPGLLVTLEQRTKAVLVAPPGAGKTTRVPLALLDAPWRRDGRIIVLEPRRLAARAAAHRMAKTLDEAVGETVGYRVRLDNRVSSRTRIEVVTEGVFTRMLLDDPELSGIAAVLFDEFHERSLDADLGLALALDAAELRDDLRLLVMSATLDGARVAQAMGDAPVLESEGRAFPVETFYREPDPLARLEDQIAGLVREAIGDQPGSILVFLPGQGEITRLADKLKDRLPADCDLFPLFGQMSPQEQDRAIAPAMAGRRKIALATSIAETSLTIEGVRIVIDSGWRRVPAFDPSTGLSTLETRRVSRAGADQRRGRAGRTEPGVCYRLWNEGQNAALLPFETPEILAADLTGLALDLAQWGIADPAQLRFLDPPPTPAWTEATTLLKALEALDASGRITADGLKLARLPLHPRLAHMVQRGADSGSGMLAAELAVLLSERGLGGDAPDLTHRLDAFRRDRSRRAEEARGLAQRWARLAGDTGRDGSVGSLLAGAFPDRVAQQSGATGRYRLANGRAASLDQTDAMARAPFLVVTEITGTAANGRIRAAAPIERTEIETEFASQIVTETVTQFDRSSRSLRARRTRMLGALKLDDAPVAVTPSLHNAEILAQGAAELGIAQLPWTRDQLALRDRSCFLNRLLGGDWPDLGDMILAADTEWLTPHLVGLTSLAEIKTDLLGNLLDTLLPWSKRQEMERLLPSHFDAPSGSRLPIDYTAENGPALEVRVQELFGLDRHPAVANGKLPLLLVLLSPAHRPIQTTRDLPGFWRGSWKDVAKDLKGRYPKHYWPDNPLEAQATSRAKPRGT